MSARIKGSYGIDAPYVPIIMAGVVVVCVFLAFVNEKNIIWWLAWALLFALQVLIYLFTTTRGKFTIWSRIIDRLGLTGSEQVLDVGCGRGMVLITAAQHLTTGRAIGIDLWRSKDQSGNDPEATTRNAEVNGVAERITLETADMSKLPFPDNTFDLVTANVAIQNIKDRDLRRETILEIVRVTKPGGRIQIVDIQYSGQYRDDLKAFGAKDVLLRNLGPIGWFGNPFFASKLVSAHKP